ncbi:MAG: Uma2 family endonuclease [Syntrophobacteraceae bacterium]|nr:Uma2 family endonuclease [Syntrophobacteraceae bacterium]
MSEPAKKRATYEDLYSIPENMTGEILDGELIVHPRPSRKHTYAAFALGNRIGTPYLFGEGGGPGGWVILIEPEIQLGEHTLVPDLAGWKKERFLWEEDQNPISVTPDWICEILSPSTFRFDKMKKMPIYADSGVGYFWLLDPTAKILDPYRLKSNGWFPTARFYGGDKIRSEPFEEIEFDLGDLWPKLQ